MNTNDLKKICLLPTNTVLDAIESLNSSGLGIVLVCSDDMQFLGTVTDGDIRKGLANQLQLGTALTNVMHRKPIIVSEELPRHLLLDHFLRTGLRAIPKIDGAGRVVGCYFIEDFVKSQPEASTLMIMAGGFGRRMGPLTKDLPKPLLKVRGKPMIQHIIEMAAAERFGNIIISVHYKHEMIEKFCGSGHKFGVNIRYIKERTPLGTGGSFGLLSSVNGPVVVTNADIMTNVGYRRMLDYHLTHRAAATLAVREHKIQNPFGVVLNNGVLLEGFEEKPTWTTNVNAGIYVLNPSLMDFIEPNKHTAMPDVIERARKAGHVVTIYPLHENWYDLGTEAEYLKHK